MGGSDTLLNARDEIPGEGPGKAEPPPVAGPNDKRPLLVVPDSRGRIRTWHYWQNQPYWRGCVVLCSQKTPESYLSYLKERRVEFIIAGKDHVDYRAALEGLNQRFGVQTVRVESGGTLNGALLREGLVDEISLLFHPSLIGGTSPRSFFRAPDLASRYGIIPLKLAHLERLEGDIIWVVWSVAP